MAEVQKQSIELKGRIKLVLRDARNGRVRYVVDKDNLVVDAGKALLAQALYDNSPSNLQVTHIAIGTGTTAPAAGDTALENEQLRTTVYSNLQGTSVTFAAFIGSLEYEGDISELGLFIDGDNANVLLSRVVITPVTKTTNDVVEILWEISMN